MNYCNFGLINILDKKMKKIKFELFLALFMLGACAMIMDGCPTDPPTPLSPARNITGTWALLLQ